VLFLTPVIAFLLTEALEASGLISLIICGLFYQVFTCQNVSQEADITFRTTVKYISHLMKQIGCILMGIISPFYIVNADEGLGIISVAGGVCIVSLLCSHFSTALINKCAQKFNGRSLVSHSDKYSINL